MFKRNIFKILAVTFFLLAGASFYNSSKNTYNKSLDVVQNKKIVKKIITPTISVRLNPIPSDSIRLKPSILPTQIIILTSIIKGSDDLTPTTGNVQTPNLGVSTNISISLSISGSSVGSFDIPQGLNQCDVLSQALSQGKIQSLNMRYNNDLGTNAVYQINGIGKENAVWWTFKVNGQSPSQGCSYIKVNNGDVVLWEYVGN